MMGPLSYQRGACAATAERGIAGLGCACGRASSRNFNMRGRHVTLERALRPSMPPRRVRCTPSNRSDSPQPLGGQAIATSFPLRQAGRASIREATCPVDGLRSSPAERLPDKLQGRRPGQIHRVVGRWTQSSTGYVTPSLRDNRGTSQVRKKLRALNHAIE